MHANCSPSEAISAACELLSGEVASFGVYVNGFVSIEALREGAQVDGLAAREDLDPAAYARFAGGWRDAGARLIGGCCEVGPAHIAAVAEVLRT